jgi:hypothetical protein
VFIISGSFSFLVLSFLGSDRRFAVLNDTFNNLVPETFTLWMSLEWLESFNDLRTININMYVCGIVV